MNLQQPERIDEMNYSGNYNQQEIATLLLAPIEAGIAVALSSKDNLIGTAQEMFALYQATNKKVAQQYPNNGLIQELLAGEHKEVDQQVFAQVGNYVKDESARQHAKEDALTTCQRAASLLAKASPQDAQGYKQWLLDVTTQVANAASAGGQKVSPEEAATIREITRVINIPQ
jgi:hypothetical protein